MGARLRLLLLASLLVIPLRADPPMTTLRVEVKSHTGRPIPQASVVVKFVRGRNYMKLGKKVYTSWQTRTNQDGVAKIPPLPQGDILIQVIAKGVSNVRPDVRDRRRRTDHRGPAESPAATGQRLSVTRG